MSGWQCIVRGPHLKNGLLVHESLTNERLAVIKILQKLHKPKESSPFQSYYTSSGRIFIRLTNSPKALELSVGTTEKEILDICKRSEVGGPSSGKVIPPRASSLGQGDTSDPHQDSTKAPTGAKNGHQNSKKHPNTAQGNACETAKDMDHTPGASAGAVAEGGTTKVCPSRSKVSQDERTNPDARNPVEQPGPSVSCVVHGPNHTADSQTSGNPEPEATPKTSPVAQIDSAPTGNPE